jgi:hypothetical protein
MQILRRIKSWYGRGNSAWDGNNGLDADLVHIDNHLPNITYAGIVTLGTATSATAAAVPGRAQLFVDGTYAVTNRDIGGSLVVQAYTPIAGALASNGTAVLVNTGSAWVNIFTAMPIGSIPLGALQIGTLPVGITITGAQIIGAVATATHALNADHAIEADHALTADSLTGSGSSSISTGLVTVGAVPTANVGDSIIVNAPHLRYMIWNGTAYVRAPWHQPGMVQYSIDNPTSIPGYLPVRGDVVYAQANYPDLVARLGLSGVGNFSLVELRGEFIRCLDNGRSIDSARVHGSAQIASLISGADTSVDPNIHLSIPGTAGTTYKYGWDETAQGRPASDAINRAFVIPGIPSNSYFTNGTGFMTAIASTSVAANAFPPGSAAARPRNVALPAWVSY